MDGREAEFVEIAVHRPGITLARMMRLQSGSHGG
jgi:hypothetical protein